MKFTKMHGCGNDYVYINCFKESVEDPVELAKLVSNRHFGIGSDGLILIKPSTVADCLMDMYNMDGSSGAMCGNGIRCVAKYMYDHKITDKTELTIETASGIKTLKLLICDEKVESVIVDMGNPVLTSHYNANSPSLTNKEQLSKLKVWETITVENKSYEMISVSMGNPHAIIFMNDLQKLDIAQIGPKFEHHCRFPDRTNTDFVEIVDRSHIKVRVWERGSGETMACGTAACASVVAAILAGYTDICVEVELLGGILKISWDQDTGHIIKQGPAVEVFSGELY